MAEIKTLDVRSLIPEERHRSIYVTCDRAVGGKFIPINDDDLKPLYYQFEAERCGESSWRYLKQQPQVWRVEIGRTTAPGVAAR